MNTSICYKLILSLLDFSIDSDFFSFDISANELDPLVKSVTKKITILAKNLETSKLYLNTHDHTKYLLIA